MSLENGDEAATAALSHNNPLDSDPINTTNLIVNYIPPIMTQQDLFSLFASQGEVESCRLIRDKETYQSLSYGFVNYFNPSDAEQAVNKLNGLKLQNKTLKVSYARPSCQVTKFTNLYVSGVPKNYTKNDLEVLFSPFGKILDSKVIPQRTAIDNVHSLVSGSPEVSKICKGIGFVRFYSHEEAVKAIEHLNGAIPHGSNAPLVVKFANTLGKKYPNNNLEYKDISLPMSQTSTIYQYENYCVVSASHVGPPPPLSPSGWVIFVYNLSPDFEDVVLWKLFAPYGAVKQINVNRDPIQNKCKGYAFVNMTYFEQAAMAIRALNGFVLDGRILKVSFKTEKRRSLLFNNPIE